PRVVGADDQVDRTGHTRTLRRAGLTDDGCRRAGEQDTTVHCEHWYGTHGRVLRASLNLRRQEARCLRRPIKDASTGDLSRIRTTFVKKSTKVDGLRHGTDDREREDRRRWVQRAERGHLVIGGQ